jgi:hypothetical protein
VPTQPGNPDGTAVPSELAQFIAEFNQREYFRAHETLEAAWKRATGPERLFLQGLIQIAVGMTHVQRGNLVGALAQLEKGAGKLARAPGVLLGVDVVSLRRQAAAIRALIQVLGPSGLGDFPWASAPVISRVTSR